MNNSKIPKCSIKTPKVLEQSQENQEVLEQLSSSSDKFYNFVPSCSKNIGINSTREGKNAKSHNHVFASSQYNREVDGTWNKSKSRELLLKRSESLRQAVRKVCNYLDIPSNYDSFRKYDSVIDWKAFARWLDVKTKTVLYSLDNRRGTRIEIMGKPVICAEDIPECSDDDARTMLSEQGKEFIRWW